MASAQRIRRDRGEVTRLRVVPRQLFAAAPTQSHTREYQHCGKGERQSGSQQPADQGVEPITFARGDGAHFRAFDPPPDVVLEAWRQRRGRPGFAQQRPEPYLVGIEILFVHFMTAAVISTTAILDQHLFIFIRHLISGNTLH